MSFDCTYFWSTRTLVNSYLSILYLFGMSFIRPQMYFAYELKAVYHIT